MPFPGRFSYERFDFSMDGPFLLLRGRHGERVLRLEDGRFVSRDPATAFLFTMNTSADDSDVAVGGDAFVKALSPGGRFVYRGYYQSEMFYDENSATWYAGQTTLPLSEVYDAASGALLATVPDELPLLHYWQWMSLDGCDLRYFNPDGNAYDDTGYLPMRAAFAPDDETFGVLFQAVSYRFRTLRFYRTADGALLSVVGSNAEPVEDFAYAPDNRTVLVGFKNGSIQLLDLPTQETIFSAWHFNSHLMNAEYSFDGKYLVIDRPDEDEIEVRSTLDGSVLWRSDAVVFDVSPVENLVAVGGEAGALELRDISSGQVIRNLLGHTGVIYALAFSPDGRGLVSSSEDCTVRLWDVSEGKFLHYFEETWGPSLMGIKEPSRIFIHSLQFLQSQDRMFGVGSWGAIVSWDLASEDRQFQVQSNEQEFRDGIRTTSGYDIGLFQIDEAGGQFSNGEYSYDLNTGALVGPIEPTVSLPAEASCDEYRSTSASGGLIFANGEDRLGGRVCVLRASNRALLGTIQVLPEQHWILRPLKLSPAGTQLIVPAYDGVIYVYQILP